VQSEGKFSVMHVTLSGFAPRLCSRREVSEESVWRAKRRFFAVSAERPEVRDGITQNDTEKVI